MINVGIIGGAGYTAGELIRILINHPQAQLTWVHSQSQGNKPLAGVHTDLWGETEMVFTQELDFQAINVLFLCSGHGESKKFLAENQLPQSLKIIDLSTDFLRKITGFTAYPNSTEIACTKLAKLLIPVVLPRLFNWLCCL
jgi:N-acetyl-gamma-glutamyl-phosphate reductase